MYLTIRNVWGCRTYRLCGGKGHWEWQCCEDVWDGFGPFPSRQDALTFARGVGSVVQARPHPDWR